MPAEPADGELWSPARMRLAYDEYLAGQLALLIVRSTLVAAARHRANVHRRDHRAGRSGPALRPHRRPADRRSPTSAKTSPPPSGCRGLLQGDVGAGKTVVALMAMAAVAESGAQSALMSPTELLAAQHFRTLKPLAETAGLGIALLTGKQSAAERRAILEGIAIRRNDHRRRHPCAVPVGRRVPQSRPDRGRRAASLRRGAAPGAHATRASTPTCW